MSRTNDGYLPPIDQFTFTVKFFPFSTNFSKANFIFASHPSHDAGQLAQQLREQGIIVRYFNKPRINQFLRITVGTDEQNERLVQTLKEDIL